MAFHFKERHTDTLMLGKGLDWHFWKIGFLMSNVAKGLINSLLLSVERCMCQYVHMAGSVLCELCLVKGPIEWD